ncbi:MAG: hypothetical protein QF464_13435, partial [Myxococcota bacterium]|nr:hypothetical protein [Myxococcota bacterium]
MIRPTLTVVCAAALSLCACGAEGDAPHTSMSDASGDTTLDAKPDAAPLEVTALDGVQVLMSLEGPFDTSATFFDHPWPSDLRLTPSGGPAMHGLPNPEDIDLVSSMLDIAAQRPGLPTIPVAWLRFDGPLGDADGELPHPASSSSSVQLLDVDPASPRRGARYPTLVRTLEPDPYVPEHLLAIAPWPGVVLPAGRTYAVIVTRDHGDALGQPLGVPLALRQLAFDQRPDGALGAQALETYAPLWETLDDLDLPREAVAAATVFTVGDVVSELFAMSEVVRSRHDLTVTDLSVTSAAHPRFCALSATVTAPAFQRGTPPFDTEGTFALDADGVPVQQGEASFPLVLALPRVAMPAGGFPLVLYFHGSGGVSTQLIDRGPVTVLGGEPTPGEGPAHVLAAHGLATASSALPVNPERVDGAGAFEYLNFANLAAFRDTFRQGVLEQRLLLDALLALEISPEAVAACDGLSLPDGASAYRLSPAPVMAMGQSMGGMYTNMVGAVEPRLTALVPTGAGGFWSWFILETELLDAAPLLALLLGTDAELTFLHPVLHLLQTAWEPA